MNEVEQYRRFEEMGEWQVRLMTPQWSDPLQALAFKWLVEKDEEAKRARVEEARVAKDAKNAAIVAALAAIAGTVLTLVAWLLPRH